MVKGLIYVRVTQAFPKDILHIGPYQQKRSLRNLSGNSELRIQLALVISNINTVDSRYLEIEGTL